MIRKSQAANEVNGVVVGNVEDKSRLQNPLAQAMVRAFDAALFELVDSVEPADIHEVGCGECRLSRQFGKRYGCPVRASDFFVSAETSAAMAEYANFQLVERSIYNLDHREDHADLVVCCEVLEHLEYPEKALRVLAELDARRYIFSVPREPLWRALNVLRGKYLGALGNTPGHLQNWSSSEFLEMVRASGFEILQVRRPLPWTMALVRQDSKG